MNEKLLSFVFVFMGGGVGATLRYSTSLIFQWLQLSPWGATLLVNTVGTFIYFLSLKLTQGQSFWMTTFVRLGVLGSLTTFSTFSYEVANAFRSGNPMQAGLIFGLNILTGVLIAIGMFR